MPTVNLGSVLPDVALRGDKENNNCIINDVDETSTATRGSFVVGGSNSGTINSYVMGAGNNANDSYTLGDENTVVKGIAIGNKNTSNGYGTEQDVIIGNDNIIHGTHNFILGDSNKTGTYLGANKNTIIGSNNTISAGTGQDTNIVILGNNNNFSNSNKSFTAIGHNLELYYYGSEVTAEVVGDGIIMGKYPAMVGIPYTDRYALMLGCGTETKPKTLLAINRNGNSIFSGTITCLTSDGKQITVGEAVNPYDYPMDLINGVKVGYDSWTRKDVYRRIYAGSMITSNVLDADFTPDKYQILRVNGSIKYTTGNILPIPDKYGTILLNNSGLQIDSGYYVDFTHPYNYVEVLYLKL